MLNIYNKMFKILLLNFVNEFIIYYFLLTVRYQNQNIIIISKIFTWLIIFYSYQVQIFRIYFLDNYKKSNVCLARQPLTVLFKVQPPTRRTSSLSTEYWSIPWVTTYFPKIVQDYFESEQSKNRLSSIKKIT